MMNWKKDEKTGHYKTTPASVYTIKKRPDGWFDLYDGRAKVNEKRDRLGVLKALAEGIVAAWRTEEFHADPLPTPTPLGADDQPLPGLPLIDVLTEDDAVKRLASLPPKARDMVDRATTLLPALPMPGAEQRTPEDDDSDVPLQVEADWHFLYTWEGQTAVTLDREDFLNPAVAFARVPRGTARKLRKALRAAGRPDLAAVSRCMKAGNPEYL